MAILLSVPLSKQAVADLRAGDAVTLSGPILVLNLQAVATDAAVDAWLSTGRGADEGWVCCIATAPVVLGSRAWTVARIDEPDADRVACALLAAGSRGLVCRGRCLATTSYALRKYGGVCFRAPENWLEARNFRAATEASGIDGRVFSAHVVTQGDGLVVAHDAQGRQVVADA
jgi:tartrate dehydratase beta subunit/fumarate hydratase class I family protein